MLRGNPLDGEFTTQFTHDLAGQIRAPTYNHINRTLHPTHIKIKKLTRLELRSSLSGARIRVSESQSLPLNDFQASLS